jgi:acyl carrier protein
MEKSDIVSKLTLIFRKIFNNSSLVIHDRLTANDIKGWDSLSHMLLISEIEKTFSVKFKLKDLNQMRSVGDIIEMIGSKL